MPRDAVDHAADDELFLGDLALQVQASRCAGAAALFSARAEHVDGLADTRPCRRRQRRRLERCAVRSQTSRSACEVGAVGLDQLRAAGQRDPPVREALRAGAPLDDPGPTSASSVGTSVEQRVGARDALAQLARGAGQLRLDLVLDRVVRRSDPRPGAPGPWLLRRGSRSRARRSARGGGGTSGALAPVGGAGAGGTTSAARRQREPGAGQRGGEPRSPIVSARGRV